MKTLNNELENIIDQIKADNSKELETMSISDYVKLSIESEDYFFFTADTDEEVATLNSQFIDYVSDLN